MSQMNFNLYQGKGRTLSERDLSLSKFKSPLGLSDDPRGYLASSGLKNAVNVALALGQPLLLTGEPGTGKTQLANSVAYELQLPLISFHAKTSSNAQDLFYQYDALRRFHDAQPGLNTGGKVQQLTDYIDYQALGQAILLSQSADEARALLSADLLKYGQSRSVVLIDEIDKAPRDFPNDILNEVDKMCFTVKETRAVFKADPAYMPLLILTSNSEKQLPDAFLRRCVFYHIEFPSDAELEIIINNRFVDTTFSGGFIQGVLNHFREIRGEAANLKLALKKKPATAELLAWLEILLALDLDLRDLSDFDPGQLESLALSYSVLAKTSADLARLKQQAR